jgi:xanthine dehydrogenase small subunit
VSKRYDQDISAVCAAFAIEVVDGTVVSARIAFGGMAATPKRASLAEAALTGGAWNEQALERAMQALAGDYQPLTDLRASSRYRSTIARNLLRRFWLETRDEAPLALAQVDAFAFDAALAKEAP